MKQIIPALAGLLLFVAPLFAKDKTKVVEQPPFCVSESDYIEVSRIVLSDTATVLTLEARYIPGRRLKVSPRSFLKDNNGETYPLRSWTGIASGGDLLMPASGKASFDLIFPSLPDEVVSIDFSGGEEEGDAPCDIWGILLKEKEPPVLERPETFPAPEDDSAKSLPEPVLRHGKAVVSGCLADYRPNMQQPLYVHLLDARHIGEEPLRLKLDANGCFRHEVEVAATTPCLLLTTKGMLRFFVQAGDTTRLLVNLRELSRRNSFYHRDDRPYGQALYVDGPLSILAEELNTVAVDTLYQAFNRVEGSDITSLVAAIGAQAQAVEDEIRRLPVSAATRRLLTKETGLLQLSLLNRIPYRLTLQARDQGIITAAQTQSFFANLQQNMADHAADTQLLKLLNDPQALLTRQYTTTFADYVEQTGYLSRLLKTDKGCFFDQVRVFTLCEQLKKLAPLTDSMKAAAERLPDAYRSLLTSLNDRLLSRLQAGKLTEGSRVCAVPDVPADSLFTAILSAYRGHVVLVDFWATWCGPCRLANRMLLPVKEALKDRDIVYVYITGEISPFQTWEQMIPDLHGDHYRLNAEQWEYLGRTLGIQGVPTYYIIDKEGNVSFRQTGFPGAERIQEELLKAGE